MTAPMISSSSEKSSIKHAYPPEATTVTKCARRWYGNETDQSPASRQKQLCAVPAVIRGEMVWREGREGKSYGNDCSWGCRDERNSHSASDETTNHFWAAQHLSQMLTTTTATSISNSRYYVTHRAKLNMLWKTVWGPIVSEDGATPHWFIWRSRGDGSGAVVVIMRNFHLPPHCFLTNPRNIKIPVSDTSPPCHTADAAASAADELQHLCSLIILPPPSMHYYNKRTL